MTYIIEARPNIVIKRKALTYKASSYPISEDRRISDYGRVMLYRGK